VAINDIEGLEKYFSEIELPETPIKISNHEMITDVNKFIDSHLSICKANRGKKYFAPYFHRLTRLHKILKSK